MVKEMAMRVWTECLPKGSGSILQSSLQTHQGQGRIQVFAEGGLFYMREGGTLKWR